MNDILSFIIFLLSDLFGALETKKTNVSTLAESMGIKSYGVSMTTLEEVFLKLGQQVKISYYLIFFNIVYYCNYLILWCRSQHFLNKALMWVQGQFNGCNRDSYYDNLTFLSLF